VIPIEGRFGLPPEQIAQRIISDHAVYLARHPARREG